MTSYRAVIELYTVDASNGQILREGDTTVTITAATHEDARAMLREETRTYLHKKSQPNIRFKSCLYLGAKLVHELQGIGVESLSPESVPNEELTPLQKRMQSGDS